MGCRFFVLSDINHPTVVSIDERFYSQIGICNRSFTHHLVLFTSAKIWYQHHCCADDASLISYPVVFNLLDIVISIISYAVLSISYNTISSLTKIYFSSISDVREATLFRRTPNSTELPNFTILCASPQNV